jgi:hypothetical protein
MTIHKLHPHGQPMPASWQDRLHAATTEEEVVELCRYFVSQFSPYEIATLPEGCRPERFVDASDVSEYAFAIVQHRCDDGQGADYVSHRLSSFFSGATTRLAQILHTQSSVGSTDQQSA